MTTTNTEALFIPLSQFQYSEQDRAKTVTFTGHRPRKLCQDIPGSSQAAYDKATYKPFFMKSLRRMINDQIRAGYRNFITGGAQGFDQLAFWAVESLKSHYQKTDPSIRIQNIVFVPVLHQESRWAEKGSFSKEEYRLMLQKADQVVVVCNEPYSKEKGPIQMNERNKAMIDNASLLIACLNEQSGGSARAVSYAASPEVNVRTLLYRPVTDAAGKLRLKNAENQFQRSSGKAHQFSSFESSRRNSLKDTPRQARYGDPATQVPAAEYVPFSRFFMREEERARTVAFAGPEPETRNLDQKPTGDTAVNEAELAEQLVDVIDGYIQKGYRNFLFSAEHGFDQVAFKAVSRLKERYRNSEIRLSSIVFIPEGCHLQTESVSQPGCKEMLQNADRIVLVSDIESLTGFPDQVKQAMISRAGILAACCSAAEDRETVYVIGYASGPDIDIEIDVYHQLPNQDGNLTLMRSNIRYKRADYAPKVNPEYPDQNELCAVF